MAWQIGQHVRCDRPDRTLEGKIIQADSESVIISCPVDKMVVCGSQKQLEKLGWHLASTVV